MEITLKKSELEQVLVNIAAFNDKGEMLSGLLKEFLPLKEKRKLQNIHSETLELYKKFIKEAAYIKDVTGEDNEKYQTEMKILLDEELTLKIEPVSLEAIEAISSSANYNFNIIEKIAK
jgi:hypothetical protein